MGDVYNDDWAKDIVRGMNELTARTPSVWTPLGRECLPDTPTIHWKAYGQEYIDRSTAIKLHGEYTGEVTMRGSRYAMLRRRSDERPVAFFSQPKYAYPLEICNRMLRRIARKVEHEDRPAIIPMRTSQVGKYPSLGDALFEMVHDRGVYDYGILSKKLRERDPHHPLLTWRCWLSGRRCVLAPRDAGLALSRLAEEVATSVMLEDRE